MKGRRPKVLLFNQRNVRIGRECRVNSNCIDAHEELISSTLKSASERLDNVNNRFVNYRRKCNDSVQSQENIQWLRQYNDLNEEATLVSKSLDNVMKSILVICHDHGRGHGRGHGHGPDEDGCAGLSCLFQDDTSVHKDELMHRLKKLRFLVFDGQKRCNLHDTDGSSTDTLRQENFRNIRMRHYEEMEYLQKEVERLEAQVEMSVDDITTQTPLQEETIPQELIQNLESFKDLCLCVFDSNIIVHDHFHKDVSCTIREIVEKWKNSFSRLHQNNQTIMRECIEKDGLERETRKLISQGLKQIQDLRKQVVEQLCKSFVGLLSDATINEQRYRLHYLRQLQEVSNSIKKDGIMKQQMKECEEEQLRNEKKARERIATKHALEEYHNSKISEEVKILKEEEERSRAEEEKRKQRLVKNSERVCFRRNKLAEKQQKREYDLEQSRKNEADKLEKLQNLAATVPYHSAIIAKKADLTKSTAARMNDIYDYPDESDLKDFQQGLKKLTGFTTEKVFSDPKFRLAHALHQSGKANSAYSLAVVKKLIPRQSERTTGIGGS